jgi:hypothetical protein
MAAASNTRGHRDTTIGVDWPVAERYEVREETEQGLTDRQVRRVVGLGQTRRRWVPAFDPDLADSVARLAEGTDEQILGWVAERGYLGLHDDEGRGETLEAIREATAHLAASRRLLSALVDRPDDDELRRLAREAAGHLVDARFLAAGAGIQSDDEPVRAGVGADIQALHALGSALIWPLQRYTWLAPRVWATQRRMGLETRMVGRGPLGVAYLQTLQAASDLVLDQKLGTQRLDWRNTPRTCVGCGQDFLPRQENQLYHDKRCGWAAQKRSQRRRAKEGTS